MNTCKLCGKEHKDETYGTQWRVCYIERTATGIVKYGVLKGYGFYEPRLTTDELWKIGNYGETAICTDRQGCRDRQIRKVT